MLISDNMRGTLLASQCRKIKRKTQIPRYEVRFTNKNHPFMWLVCKTREKFYCIADDPASLVFEAIETIIWKLTIAPVVRIVSKYFEMTGAIGTIIWKPGFRHLFSKSVLFTIFNCLGFSKLFYCYTVWSGTFKQNIHKLQLVQNVATRVLTNTSGNWFGPPLNISG